MNFNTRFRLILAIAILASCTAVANSQQKFDFSGLSFTILDETQLPNKLVDEDVVGTCELSRPATRYSGDVVIPEIATYDGKNYIVTKIGDYAFSEYDLTDGNHLITSVTMPETIIEIGNSAFKNCVLITDLTLPKNLQDIGEYAFANTGITEIVVPDDVEILKQYTFYGCNNLKSIKLSESLEIIGNDVFSHCENLTNIEIPDEVKSIGQEAFYGCWRLQEITIPDSVTTIGAMAFELCHSLESISLGKSVEYIGDGAFLDCASLTNIYSHNLTPPTVFESSFESYHFSQTKLNLYEESVEDYNNHEVWTKFLVMTDVKELVTDNVNISVNNRIISINGNASIETAVYDIKGNAIYAGSAREIAISNAGIYIVQVKFDNNRIVKKVHVR
jgi:hypothetical protein